MLKENTVLKIIVKFLCFYFIIGIIIIISCTESGTDPRDENVVLPDSNLTYNDHIYKLFLLKCGSREGCHSYTNPARNLVLIEYDMFRYKSLSGAGGGLLILNGNGEASPLYKILVDSYYAGVPKMPKDGPYLNSNQTDGVRQWINEGAPISN